MLDDGEAGLVVLSGGDVCCCKEVMVEEGGIEPLGLGWHPGKRGSCRGYR